jgi:tetratricopeptide (TPR) repeat protein
MPRLRILTMVLLFGAAASWSVAAAPTPAAAGAAATRAQALAALELSDAQARLDGAIRLGKVGTMPDADRLVDHLSDDDPQVRAAAEASLWRIWSRSGDAKIDALFEQGVQQMAARELDEALATFSTIVARKPDFAEGWNKRATVLFMLGRFEDSMKDCDEVLKRNPNHFGAMSGYAQMLAQKGQSKRAIEYFQRALKVNPNLPGAEESIEILQQQLHEERSRMI